MPRLLLLASLLILALTACRVSQPGSIESSMVNQVKRRVTIGDKDVKNPIPYSEAAAREGQAHFAHHCQVCHGLDGQNTGVPFAEKMSPPVPDLKSADVQEFSDGQLQWIIKNGVSPSGMPAWNGLVDQDEVWKIVLYLRHLPAKGSLGSPAVFQEEAEEHEAVKAGAKPPGHTHSPPPGSGAAPRKD